MTLKGEVSPLAATLSEPKPEEKEQALGNEALVAHKAGDATGQTASDLNSLRVKVAELLGATWGHAVYAHDMKWHVHLGNPPFEFDSSWAGKPPTFEECEKEIDVPDYPSDLNACAEFEKGLTRDQMIKYAWFIGEQQQRQGEWTTFDVAQAIHATAEQRCRAFVATMEGKHE